MNAIYALIKNAEIIFWDFDGVIKESNNCKAEGFRNIFSFADKNVQDQIVKHHLDNHGLSRYEKIPLYTQWCGIEGSRALYEMLSHELSEYINMRVINAPYVTGALDLLKTTAKKSKNVVTTHTPYKDIIKILNELGIINLFDKVYGLPSIKQEAISESLNQYRVNAKDCVYIGDSIDDMKAAAMHNITFVLRCNKENLELQRQYKGIKVRDLKFNEECTF